MFSPDIVHSSTVVYPPKPYFNFKPTEKVLVPMLSGVFYILGRALMQALLGFRALGV